VKTGRGVEKGCCLTLMLLTLYSKYFTKYVLEGFDVFRRIRRVICNVKYAYDHVLLAKEEIFIVTQGVLTILTALKTSFFVWTSTLHSVL